MSFKINNPEAYLGDGVMLLGRDYPLFISVPPLERIHPKSNVSASEQRRALFIDDLNTVLPVTISLRDGIGQLATSITPYRNQPRINVLDLDPFTRAKKMIKLPDRYLRKQAFGKDLLSLDVETNELELNQLGLCHIIPTEDGQDETTLKIMDPVRAIFERLRILVAFPGTKHKPRQILEGRPDDDCLEETRLVIGKFYLTEFGPFDYSDEGDEFFAELFRERFGFSESEDFSVENITCFDIGRELKLPHGRRMLEPRISFYLLEEAAEENRQNS